MEHRPQAGYREQGTGYREGQRQSKNQKAKRKNPMTCGSWFLFLTFDF
jgi:hypothetical protein